MFRTLIYPSSGACDCVVELIMMDILMSETCWTHKKWNKIASHIKLVFHSSTSCWDLNSWTFWAFSFVCIQIYRSTFFYIHGSVHRESNLITVQQDATHSVYYISIGSSTCFGCWHPSSGARTTVITASGIDKSHLVGELLNTSARFEDKFDSHLQTSSKTAVTTWWLITL